MKSLAALCALMALSIPAYAQKTAYGSCPERAQVYQERYESGLRAQDLVCYQKALERELERGSSTPCPRSAQHYQDAYHRNLRSGDLVCFQKALERELR